MCQQNRESRSVLRLAEHRVPHLQMSMRCAHLSWCCAAGFVFPWPSPWKASCCTLRSPVQESAPMHRLHTNNTRSQHYRGDPKNRHLELPAALLVTAPAVAWCVEPNEGHPQRKAAQPRLECIPAATPTGDVTAPNSQPKQTVTGQTSNRTPQQHQPPTRTHTPSTQTAKRTHLRRRDHHVRGHVPRGLLQGATPHSTRTPT